MKKNLLKSKALLLILSAALSFLVFYLYFSPLPNLKEFLEREYSVDFFDRNGNLLQATSLSSGLRREFVSFEDIPEEIKKAFVKAEDRRFYLHKGADFLSISRALFQNIKNGKTVSGASTITMQLSRLINPGENRNFRGKIKETLYAFRLEKRLSKDKILELYLNNIPFGNNLEGIRSASRYYFSKDLANLSKEETMLLSVIPRRPKTYSPKTNPENASKKAAAVFGYPEEKLLEAAENSRNADFSWPFEFPHLVEEAKKNLSENQKNLETQKRLKKQTEVFLTVDLELQKFSEFALKNALRGQEKSRIFNASLVVLENESGNILSWIGNPFWSDFENSGQIDGVLVKNQMGSAMKPFLFASALESGKFSAYQILEDIPMEFGSEKIYLPRNFNNRYNGPVLFRNALASSLNIPAVSILSEISVPAYLEKLNALGFRSLESGGEKNGLGLALGSGEVTLLELVSAFSVFTRDGIYIEPEYLKENGGKSGQKTNDKKESRKVFSSDTSRQIADFLGDKSARATGFGLSQVFQTKYPSIFKTGTANQFQNIVAVGATPEYSVGVWMGNFSGNTVVGKTGSSLPAKAAREVLDFLTEDGATSFCEPENFSKIKICAISGMYPNENCHSVLEEYAENSKIGEIKNNVCIWHRKNEHGKTITYFPAEFQEWHSHNHINSQIEYSSSPLSIASPNDGSVFFISETDLASQGIPVKVTGGFSEHGELNVFYDGEPLSENGEKIIVKRPFEFLLPLEKGFHSLSVVLGDETQEISFEVR